VPITVARDILVRQLMTTTEVNRQSTRSTTLMSVIGTLGHTPMTDRSLSALSDRRLARLIEGRSQPSGEPVVHSPRHQTSSSAHWLSSNPAAQSTQSP
jgi:hypothetical protein